MNKWWDIRDPDNRATLGWLGAGFAAVIAALWAAFLHFDSPKSGDSSGNCNITSSGIGSGVIRSIAVSRHPRLRRSREPRADPLGRARGRVGDCCAACI